MEKLSLDKVDMHLRKDLAAYISWATDDQLKIGPQAWPPDITSDAYASATLIHTLRKKFVDPKSVDKTRSARALAKFLECNDACAKWVYKPTQLWDEELLGHFDDELYRFYHSTLSGSWDLRECFLKARTGPGAALDAIGGNFYLKMFSSRFTTTSESLYDAFIRHTSYFPLWASAEKHRSPLGVRQVRGNKFGFVPKTVDIDRTICTEPSLNMFYQLGAKEILESAIKRFYGIDFSVQPDRNRELCRLGSIDGSFATIDLSSASDTVSLSMLRRFLPQRFVALLEVLRSKETQLPDGSWVPLHMVSTMGNGVTFPLQTLLFAAAVSAVYRLYGLPLRRPDNRFDPGKGQDGNFGVFGDDIICVGFTYTMVCRLLGLLGFTVNHGKSFNQGHFRESCGHDYLAGRFVRGVYCKHLSSEQDSISLYNRLVEWSTIQGLDLSNTLRYTRKGFIWRSVPLWETDVAGIRVPFSDITDMNRDENGSFLYKRWVAEPIVIRFRDDGTARIPKALRRKLKGFLHNPDGLFLALLQQSLRDGTLSVRQDRVRYQLRSGVAPNWEQAPLVVRLLQPN